MNPQGDQEDGNCTDNTKHDDNTRVLGGEVLSLDKFAGNEFAGDNYSRHFEVGGRMSQDFYIKTFLAPKSESGRHNLPQEGDGGFELWILGMSNASLCVGSN